MAHDPVIEVFLSRDGDAWRLYTHGWVPPYLGQKLDVNGEALLEREPDLEALERFMFALDAPYVKRVTASGSVELEARGRSAIVFGEWLDGLIPAATP